MNSRATAPEEQLPSPSELGALPSAAWNWLETILDHTASVIYVKDRDSRHVLVNRRFEEVFGTTRAHVLGKNNHDLFPAETAAALTAQDRAVIASGVEQHYEEVLPPPNGARRFQSLKFPLRDASGRVCGLCGISTDVTDQRTAEARIRQQQALTQQLLESSADGILSFDTAYRITVWNRGMERISGIPAERILGRDAFEVFPFLIETGEDAYMREALAGHTSVSRDRPYAVPETDRQGFYEAYYAPVHDAEGNVAGGLAVIRDITERRRAEVARAEAEAAARRFAFLAQAGEVLSSSLDYEQTLRDVARLALPELGDLCIVDVIEDGRIRRVAAIHVSAEKSALLEELRRRYPASLDSPQPAARVMRTGRPELLADITGEIVAAHTLDAQHAALIQAIGMRSHLAVPLVARGAIVGAISLGISESARRYGPADEALARELARRAALAVDNARLYRTAQDELAERRRAEEALRLSESRFRAIMEQSPLATQILTADGRIARVNRAWEDLWGVTLDQVPEYNAHTDRQLEARGIADSMRRAFAGEAVAIDAIPYDPNDNLPNRTRHRDSLRWVRAFVYPIKDTGGAVREVVLVHEDVSARVRAEERVRASEDRLKIALQAGRMLVWEWNLVTQRVECSENAREFWGVHSGPASDFDAIVHPDDRAAMAQAVETTLATGEPYLIDSRLLSPNGMRWVQIRGRLERDAEGKPARIVGVTADITELKAAEEATRLLADAGAVLGTSLNAHVTLQNLARVTVPRLADYCAVDLVGENGELERVSVSHVDPAREPLVMEVFERFPPRRDDIDGPWQRIITGKPTWMEHVSDEMLQAVAQSPEHLALLRELGMRSCLCVPLIARGGAIGVLSLIYGESGRRYGTADVELANDLARRAAIAVDNARLYEQLRIEDQRKDEFLATLAHELRNPLAPIRNGLEILRHAQPGAPAEATRQIMERQLGHMVRLIDDLLDLSRVSRGKVQLHRERLEIGSVVAAALETSRPMIEAAGLELQVRLPAEPALVEGDPTRLSQVLSNLLNNAAKYTERGGRIAIEARRDGPSVVLSVKDTGVGIPPAMLGQVFEMFVQVGRSLEHSQGGLGIGLTLVKRLVELHGGEVWAESDGPGRGSTFFVRLKVAPASAAPAAAAPPEPERLDGARRRVVVVDDNRDAAQTLAILLELEGHEVRTAASGAAALEVVAAFRPDVAVLDIGMPGMNGYELARRLRADPALAGITLIALTGWGQAEDRRRSREAGFDHHLTKPVDPREVHVLVERSARR